MKKIFSMFIIFNLFIGCSFIESKSFYETFINPNFDIEINERGLDHPLYKNKKKKFNTPAFNFDEVVTMPQNSVLLASNPINKVQGLNFKVNDCDIWGLQYHPEITYNKMINIIVFRKEKLLKKEAFSDEKEINSHIQHIESENKKLDKISRMRELENWLNYLNLE